MGKTLIKRMVLNIQLQPAKSQAFRPTSYKESLREAQHIHLKGWCMCNKKSIIIAKRFKAMRSNYSLIEQILQAMKGKSHTGRNQQQWQIVMGSRYKVIS